MYIYQQVSLLRLALPKNFTFEDKSNSNANASSSSNLSVAVEAGLEQQQLDTGAVTTSSHTRVQLDDQKKTHIASQVPRQASKKRSTSQLTGSSQLSSVRKRKH